MSHAVVELTGVVREYPGSPPVRALDGVDLRIEAGELVAIVGPSGSGKSTLLHVLGTLDRADAGTVRIDGHDVGALSDTQLSALRARRIGFVFQQFFLTPGVSALDNVADGLLYTGLSLRERRDRAAAGLAAVGLSARVTHQAHQLSGGERQRVAVARALAGSPSLLLADEPTGNLDTVAGRGVVELLHELHRSGTTVVVITHDLDVARSLPRQVHLRDGRIERDRVAAA
ncbi:ABC transporter ATP-binding protein [Jiangella rhizosphaerae]|nr:ABC transporter ATP-binding protein [Jiangella rhizosphaerae]